MQPVVVPASARPRVLCVVNRPGWAHDRKTDALVRVLGDRYYLDKRFQADLTAADLEAADAILFYYWLQIDELPHLRPLLRDLRDRLLLGVCSHYELDGAWREPGLATLSEARAVFVNNRLLFDELAPLLPVAVHYTPNGVDTNFFRPVDPPRAPDSCLRVGWAGSLTNHGPTHRGVQEVIAPAAAMVGAELRLAAREERWRNAAEMAGFYQSIDVYVCASRSEGTPNPCLEAAACGLPVVTTRVGNMLEFIRDGENGFLVERTVESVADRLAVLRDDAALRARMGVAARATAEGWDWRRQALRYVPLFDTVINGASGA